MIALEEEGTKVVLGISPLLILRATTLSFFNPFRRAVAENAQGAITIQVKWGRERFNIPIPTPNLTPLSQLIATLSTQTGLPIGSFKLISKGSVLRDPSSTIASYGITDGSVLVLVGKSGEVPHDSKTSIKPSGKIGGKNRQPETTNQVVLVDWIKNLVEGILKPLEPSLKTFEANTMLKGNDTKMGVDEDDKGEKGNGLKEIPEFGLLQKEHARLSELLLRGLLDLDGVDIPSEWNEARKERKEGVKRVQAELTSLDEAWARRKSGNHI
ncbi:hypothetical protein TREMEDRAFT_73829 [Tremella mesenterica DSM 1558]|uniref:uncharacterized protein n=1 Tax=Tremella mesenterica (strain ATCC 24925 / CBS 8224 / DSM 1558 / NBRC 9311 / NRRL Y-6157 / RJB 2259-6 / UBC 559-6) TaxID=578456 RepID=UPI0003F496B2|nr:uncharacterized protein TREMEDRAFT_73829 [Tremella mesenterica DSM 1558]EIW69375.1 hypothetical protein TREMEDRAFT_73829 [Tremella mesenterica DSM 1558]